MAAHPRYRMIAACPGSRPDRPQSDKGSALRGGTKDCASRLRAAASRPNTGTRRPWADRPSPVVGRLVVFQLLYSWGFSFLQSQNSRSLRGGEGAKVAFIDPIRLVGGRGRRVMQ